MGKNKKRNAASIAFINQFPANDPLPPVIKYSKLAGKSVWQPLSCAAASSRVQYRDGGGQKKAKFCCAIGADGHYSRGRGIN